MKADSFDMDALNLLKYNLISIGFFDCVVRTTILNVTLKAQKLLLLFILKAKLVQTTHCFQNRM